MAGRSDIHADSLGSYLGEPDTAMPYLVVHAVHNGRVTAILGIRLKDTLQTTSWL